MATVAWQGGDGRLTVWTSTQSVFLARARLAEALDRRRRASASSRRRLAAASAARSSGVQQPDRRLRRDPAGAPGASGQQPARGLPGRAHERARARVAAHRRRWRGRILAKDVRIVGECGAYAGLAPEVMLVTAMRSDNMHRLENVRSHATMVYTNNRRGAFRGFGGQQMASR